MIRLNAKEFDEIVTYIREHYGINLEKKQVLIECRLARELERRGITSFARYMELMMNDRTGTVSYTHLGDGLLCLLPEDQRLLRGYGHKTYGSVQ